MSKETITSIIDKVISEAEKFGFNLVEEERIPAEMLDTSKEENDGMRYWKPVPSTVTDNDLKEIEDKINAPLPGSFKTILKHKHFCELAIDSANFFDHSIGKWKQVLMDKMFDEQKRKYTIDKGLIPFCDYEDWGFLCFDTKRPKEDNEYPVMLWDFESAADHLDKYDEKAGAIEELFPDLPSMLTELSKRQDDLQKLWQLD